MSTSIAARPVPAVPNRFFEPYFAGLVEQRILVPQCSECKVKQFPPREVCGNCRSIEFDWVDMSTTATVYTFAIVYRPFHPWFAEKLPYAVIVAELEDGIRIMGSCFSDDIESIECGDTVVAEFVDNGENLRVLQWRSAVQSGGSKG